MRHRHDGRPAPQGQLNDAAMAPLEPAMAASRAFRRYQQYPAALQHVKRPVHGRQVAAFPVYRYRLPGIGQRPKQGVVPGLALDEAHGGPWKQERVQ